MYLVVLGWLFYYRRGKISVRKTLLFVIFPRLVTFSTFLFMLILYFKSYNFIIDKYCVQIFIHLISFSKRTNTRLLQYIVLKMGIYST